MSSTSSCQTGPKCSKCQKGTTDAVCKDCAASSLDAKEKHEENEIVLVVESGERGEEDEKSDEDCVKMEIDTDLTTTETLDDDLDDLDEKPLVVPLMPKQQPQRTTTTAFTEKEQSPQKQLQLKPTPATPPEQPPAVTIKVETETEAEAEIKPDVKLKPSTNRAGKVTRSSLNGARSPQIMKRLRKSTRSTRFKSKLTGRSAAGGATNGHNGAGAAGSPVATSSSATSGGKPHGKLGGAGGGNNSSPGAARNRRTLFKRPAQKTPRVQASTRFVKSVFYKGSYMQIGDIVSIVDSEQNVYYAQIRGLLVDAYCEKSAFLTWLIPTQDSPDPKDGFDPATYLIGPDEELSRKLCYLEFIMHAPSNYYFDRTTPFPLPDVDEYISQRTGGYIWTRLPIFKRERERERERVGKAAA